MSPKSGISDLMSTNEGACVGASVVGGSVGVIDGVAVGCSVGACVVGLLDGGSVVGSRSAAELFRRNADGERRGATAYPDGQPSGMPSTRRASRCWCSPPACSEIFNKKKRRSARSVSRLERPSALVSDRDRSAANDFFLVIVRRGNQDRCALAQREVNTTLFGSNTHSHG